MTQILQNNRTKSTRPLAKAAGLAAVLFALAACQGVDDLTPKAKKDLPRAIINKMKAKDMSFRAPILVRVFKEEAILEVWKQKRNGRYALVTHYEICKWSGQLGPKYREGDRQAPEGFYNVAAGQMNPKSQFHLAFNTGFPNRFDRANGRTGSHLMVHGACSSAGCYSMTDPQMEEIYAFARESFKGGQKAFQFQAFPFRMTAENMARYKGDDNFEFWQNIKEGYDHFEITKRPPQVAVCGKKYVFNTTAEGPMRATASCPVLTQPPKLVSAYNNYSLKYDAAFEAALEKSNPEKPVSTIQGLKESKLVAAWSKKRRAGVKVSRTPPSIGDPIPEPPKPKIVEAVVETAPVKAIVKVATQTPEAQASTLSPQPETVASAAPIPTPNPTTPQATDPNQNIVGEVIPEKKPWWKFGK